MIDQFVVNDSINTTFYLKMHFKENLILWINSLDNNKNQRKFVFNKY